MKTGGVCLLILLLMQVAKAQPATVPGVRMQEPPQRDVPREAPRPVQPSVTYLPTTDTLPALTAADSARRGVGRNRYLALDRFGLMGKFRRYRIAPGETMAFRNWSEGQKYRYPLQSVSDTAFTIAFQNELYEQAQPLSFPLRDVRAVYLHKEIPFVNQAAYLLPAAAVVFLVADFVNPRTQDGQGRFIFDPKALVPAGFLAVGGGICYKLSNRKYRINQRNRLQVLWTL